jgi:hypothetical protein
MAVPKDAPAPKSSQKDVKEESLSQTPQIPPPSGQMLPPSIPTGENISSFDIGPMILPHSAPIPKILVAASQPVPHSSLPHPSQDQGLQNRHRNLHEDEEDGDETESDPDQQLEDHELPAFDWNGLAKRYDAAMQQAEKNEDDLGVEFKMLANVRIMFFLLSLSLISQSISLLGPVSHIFEIQRGLRRDIRPEKRILDTQKCSLSRRKNTVRSNTVVAVVFIY